MELVLYYICGPLVSVKLILHHIFGLLVNMELILHQIFEPLVSVELILGASSLRLWHFSLREVDLRRYYSLTSLTLGLCEVDLRR